MLAISFFVASLRSILQIVVNPLFLFGGVAGAVVGWSLCWIFFVLPYQKNLGEREAQLEHWSQLNQQLQEQTMDNRSLSQTELKQYIAANQESAAEFAEVQRRLQEREIRLSETPIAVVAIPIFVLAMAFAGVVLLFKSMNQRALATVEHVLHLAPHEMVHEIVERHIALNAPRAAGLLTVQSPDTRTGQSWANVDS